MNHTIRLTTVIIIIVILLFLQKETCLAQQDFTFEHFDIDNGLPDPTVSCILKDRPGYLWIGTGNGLSRFDGYQFKTYLGRGTNHMVKCIYEDKSGTLWVGTLAGLNKYDWITDTFKLYKIPIETSGLKTIFESPGKEAIFESPGIEAICEDRNGNFWVGTRSALYKFSIEKGNFSLVKGKSGEPNVLRGKSIWAIYQDNRGNLWIGAGHNLRNDGGLFLYDPSSGIIKQFVHDPSNPKSLLQNLVTAIYQDKQGSLWIGTYRGLEKFDYADQTFIHFGHDNHGTNSLSNNAVKCISEDDDGNLLIGTVGGGLNKFNLKSGKFSVFSLNKNENDNKNIAAISLYTDNSGIVWLGTETDGLYKITPQSKSFFRAQNSVKNAERIKNMLKGLVISSMYRDSRGVIWIGSSDGVKSINPDLIIGPSFFNGRTGLDNSIFEDKANKLWFGTLEGLYIIDLKTKKFIRYIHDPYDSNSISDNQITSIVEDTSGTVWLGTFNHGIEKYNEKNGTFKHFPLNPPDTTPPAYSYRAVRSMFVDSHGLIWLGTYKGLATINTANETFKWYIPHDKDLSSQWSKIVYGFLEDHNGVIWLATGMGLVRFNRQSGTFTFYGDANSTVDVRAKSLIEDKDGNIWFPTFTMITMFNPRTKKYKNFAKNYGLNEFYSWAKTCKDSSGNFYFGYYGGITIFNPDSIYSDNPAPPVVFTDFKFSDQSVQLDSSISVKKTIELTYQQNEFSIEFSALNFINSFKNQYAYKLEGFDKDWIYCGTRHQVTYTNLNYGTYAFRVIGSNSDEIWNKKGTSLTITVLPPWWRTTWSYISYGLIFVFSLYGLRRYELNRIKLKDKIKMDDAVLKEREETDKMKSTFFSNISHEFRTPLTLILGPAEKINSQTSNDIVKDSGIIKRNSKRLLQLVNQLLDLSRLESGKLKLEASKGNIVSFVKGIALSFESLSEDKDITLKIESEKEYIEVFFDKEKMIKILSNILSNAFKFTPQDGKITVSIIETESSSSSVSSRILNKSIEIKIRDTGIGIPKEEIPKLFDRFYQVDSSFTKEYEGTGIGLALTKELVELHHGNISAESEMGQFTEFTIILPLGKEHLKEEEIVFEKRSDKSEVSLDENIDFIHKNLNEASINDLEVNSLKEDKTIILVVEDNYDMREYIKESLDSSYIVEEAVNGEQGIRKAVKIIPDLIISDMMMPKMDGNEMTRILKKDEMTSHIPVIILTARSGQENKLEGLQTGADDYLTKPFDIKELQIRIENLISIRKKLQEKFSRIENKTPKPIEKKLSSIDEKFIIKVTEIIGKHISEEEFSMEDLGKEVGMSRMQIHRKLKALTGKSASRYIRSFRLEKAKQILNEKNENISEVAYSLGFGSPAYFTRCFKEEFGYPPSEFKI
jgi:signal transduction histidine kinase/ligand-binding sensor domain-containing protein/DNA-binding response OmpR family regulator